MIGSRPRLSMAHRLLLAQVLVVAAMAVTVVGVAGLVGPTEFEHHMNLAGHSGGVILEHAAQAFRAAGLTAIAGGLTMAAVGAIGVSVLLSRRIGAALGELARGAERVAAGDYGAPVQLPSSDRELDAVAASFNSMAARIADTEATRRRMLTDLSHEMRTPLTAIDLLLEGLEDGMVTMDSSTLSTLRAQSARLSALASDIRSVSDAEEGRLNLQLEPVELQVLIGHAIATVTPLADNKGVRLEVSTPVPATTVRADRRRIGQVLDNLLRNAIQHSGSGSTVRLWTDVGEATVRIGVLDEGRGISAADLPHVFERFFRGGPDRHDQAAGVGVGLTISRACVVAHGGTLTASSSGPGKGAEFVVTLPQKSG